MARKNAVKEFFVVSGWTAFGMRLYLSNVGFINNGIHHGVWEPGFGNAKQYLNYQDALNSSRVAASDLPNNKGIIVQRHRVNEDGKVIIDVIEEPESKVTEE